MPRCTHTPTPSLTYTHLYPEHTSTPSRRYPLYWCISSSKLNFPTFFSQKNTPNRRKIKNIDFLSKKYTLKLGVLGVDYS